MMMRADDSYVPAKGCEQEEILSCLAKSLAGEVDYDACKAACADEENAEEEVVGNGLATVSKVSVPAAQEVPSDAVNVKVGTIKLTAGEEDTKVSSVEISRDGLATFTKATLEVALRGANVETAYAGVSPTSNTAKVKFSPALTIKAGKSETFDVVVQMPGNTEANNTHNFSITDVVVTNGKSEGTPVKLGTIKTTSALSKTVSVSMTNGDASAKAGETDKSLGKITVEFDNAAGTLNRFTLVSNATPANTDKIGEAFDNIEAYVDDKKVGNVSWTDDKIIVSDLNLSKDVDERVVIELKADIVYGKKSADYSFKMDSIDVSEKNAAYGMTAAPLPAQTVDSINVVGNDITFEAVALSEDEAIPGDKNIVVFEGKFKAATDTTIKSIDITPTITTIANFTTMFKTDSAKLIVNGDDYDLADADILGGALFTVPVNVDIDANVPAKIQIKLSTNVPAAVLPEVTTAFTVDITSAVSTENSTIDYATTLALTATSDTLSIEEGKVVLDDATVAGPVTRSLFSNQKQEVGRFSIQALKDDATLNSFDLKLTNVAPLTDALAKTLFNGKLTLVYVTDDSEENVSATLAFDNSDNTLIHVTNVNRNIKKDEVANFKLMANLSKLDATTIGGTTLFTVVNGSAKIKTSTRSDVTNDTPQDLSTAVYELRITAPEIAISKYSENQFKVTIKNIDADNAIDIANLKYTVKTKDGDYQNAGADVCLTTDVKQITCLGAPDGGIGGLPVTSLGGGDTLTKGQTKTYYIVVDGNLIEPELLKATISSLDYDKTGGTPAPENYNVTAQ